LAFSGVLPLSGGLYQITTNGSFSNYDIPPAAGFDYTWTLEVAAVPVPTTLALMGLGLAGIGFAREKKAKGA